jgi:hypothetical protein
VANYRQTMGLQTDSASTELLRATMIHYRALFGDLTGLRDTHRETGRDRIAENTSDTPSRPR